MTDRWGEMSPRERAVLIRAHLISRRHLSADVVCDLFGLSLAGLRAIKAGADWKPEYTVAEVAPVEGQQK